MKVFGIGLPKTGTTSLGACFEMLGYRHTCFDFEALAAYMQGNDRLVWERVECSDSFEDAPWCVIYEEADRRYPNAKFILTTRSSSTKWMESGLAHAEREAAHNPKAAEVIRAFTGYYERLGVDMSDPRNAYDFHNRCVQEYFAGRPGKLLTVCWEHGDGWAELCGFLGKPVPPVPFPHLNAKPAPERVNGGGFTGWLRRLAGRR